MPKLRSVRLCLSLLAALLLFGGCARPADPLDWRVAADAPVEYNDWLSQVATQMPDALQEEFVHAFNELVVVSGRAGIARSPNDANDPMCLRLNHRTVRQVLLDGYDCETTRLKNRVALDSELMLHDLSNDADSDPRVAKRTEATVKARQSEIASDKKRLAEIAQRVRALTPPP